MSGSCCHERGTVPRVAIRGASGSAAGSGVHGSAAGGAGREGVLVGTGTGLRGVWPRCCPELAHSVARTAKATAPAASQRITGRRRMGGPSIHDRATGLSGGRCCGRPRVWHSSAVAPMGRVAAGRRDRSADVPRRRRAPAAAHRGRHAEPARAAQRDVDRPGHRAARRARGRSPPTTTAGSWCSPAPGRAFCSGLDLKDYGDHPEHRRAARSGGSRSARCGTTRGWSRSCGGCPSRSSPRSTARRTAAACASALGAELRIAGESADVQQHRHRQRADQHRAGRELAAAPADRRGAHATTSCSPAASSTPPRRCRMGLVSRVVRRRRAARRARSRSPRACASSAPTGWR